MEISYALPEGPATVRIDRSGSGLLVTVLRPGQPPAVHPLDAWSLRQGRLTFQWDGRRWTGYVAQDGAARLVALEGQIWRLQPPRPRSRPTETTGASLTAAMPGKVLDVLVQPGDEVAAGATLVIVEAMKMELRIAAPAGGVVGQVLVRPGDVVDQGQRLVEFG